MIKMARAINDADKFNFPSQMEINRVGTHYIKRDSHFKASCLIHSGPPSKIGRPKIMVN